MALHGPIFAPYARVQKVGMLGSIEWSLAEHRLDSDGDLWEPPEQDPTEGRESSMPFMLAPYAGQSLPAPFLPLLPQRS
jgi:hypothetical protein